ncbi:MAG TPA: thiamine-phosphate kinase [Rhodothermales bacterium]|nr:thiamine-phosphate kinase [Rhodothermales bacterium]
MTDNEQSIPDDAPEPAFTPINEVGEFGLIDRMRAILGDTQDEQVLAGISDDAAVYRVGDGRVHVVTTDALVEGVHFDRMFSPMDLLGFKSISVNASDVAAMNALPRYATAAIGIPANMSVEMIEALYRGMKRAAELYGLSVIGGDTTAARSLLLSVTVIGEAAEADVVFRSGARPGDALCVTGDLGGAYGGLKVLLNQRQQLQERGEAFVPDLQRFSHVIQRQLAPTARVDVVREWASQGVRPHALIDISDGLASEVYHLCEQSGCGAIIDAAALPIDLQTRVTADEFDDDVETYALFGGEDYELLFALPPSEIEKLASECITVVGEFTDASQGIRVRVPDGNLVPLEMGGFQHFGGLGGG